MDHQESFATSRAVSPSYHPTVTASTHQPTPSKSLSAMAPPFVPIYDQTYHTYQAQANLLHQQHVQIPLHIQHPHQAYPVATHFESHHGQPQRKFPPKHLKPSTIKRKNQAMYEEKTRMYQDWELEQHHRTSPRKPRRQSFVLPEGDYIGYYFKVEPSTVTGFGSSQKSQIDGTCRMMESMKNVIISPSDGMEYRFSHEGPAGILPLMPLHEPVFRQSKLETDYRTDDTNALLNKFGPSGRYLSLLESDVESTFKSAQVSDAATPKGGPNHDEHKHDEAKVEATKATGHHQVDDMDGAFI